MYIRGQKFEAEFRHTHLLLSLTHPPSGGGQGILRTKLWPDLPPSRSVLQCAWGHWDNGNGLQAFVFGTQAPSATVCVFGPASDLHLRCSDLMKKVVAALAHGCGRRHADCPLSSVIPPPTPPTAPMGPWSMGAVPVRSAFGPDRQDLGPVLCRDGRAGLGPPPVRGPAPTQPNTPASLQSKESEGARLKQMK